MNQSEIWKLGGLSVLKKYGKAHFSKMGKMGARIQKKLYGPDYYKKLSAAGVKARQEKAKRACKK